MPKMESNGIQLHYEEMGSGSDTIVFSLRRLCESLYPLEVN